MNTLLNAAGGGFGGDLQARSTVTNDPHSPTGDIFSPRGKGDVAPVSLFSRLLAGKLAGSQRDDFGTERTSTQDDPGGQADSDHEADAPVTARSDTNGTADQAPGTESGEHAAEDGQLPWTDGAVDLAGGFQSWGGLAGMLQITEMTGLGNGMIPDLTASGGIPVELRSRLSAEIAANFSDRNGTQLITFKFEADHLGQIDVRLQAKADHLTVRLLVATRESEAALRENIKDLGEAIQKRTGRFQQVEVRVDLRSGEDPGQESADEDSGRSPEQDPWDGAETDPDTGGGSDNRDISEVETEPDDRAQGG